jgi:hypothetical protein
MSNTVDVVPRQPDEEIFRWHGVLDITDEARQAIEDLAELEGMSFEAVVEEVQRRRYRYSQVGWPMMLGDEPREKLPDWMGDSLTTDMNLPTGTISLTTHMGFGRTTKVRLRP